MRLKELYLSADQVKVLASGFRVDLVYAFRLHGPASIPELAPKLNRDQDSLYHHVRKLLSAGLLKEVGKRRKSTRTETVYDTVADRLRLKPKPWDEEYADLAMKLFETDFRMGLEHCRGAVETYHASQELNEMQYVRRMPVRLSPTKLREFKKRLVELDAWVTEASRDREGQAMSILIAVNPLPS